MSANLKELLTAEMEVYDLVQKGASFPRVLFVKGPVRDQVATFDAAYDLSCEVLGMHVLDVLDEGDQIRFLPSLVMVG